MGQSERIKEAWAVWTEEELTIRIKNWKQFQHFKDRKPPWIKLYRDLLDDPEWHELDPLSAKVLVMLWLIASENNGELPSVKKLTFRLRMFEKQLLQTLTRLSHWLIQDDITPISSRYHDDAPETETETYKEETETENTIAPTPDNGSGSKQPVSWNRTFNGITPEMVETWTKAYPACDIPQHLYRMDQWLLSNPTKAKKKNYYRFITNWLTRAQEKGGR
jgi:hypothetical protein